MVTTPLRERVRRAIRIRNMSPRTEEVYISALVRFAKHFGRSPDRLGAPEIEEYLYHLRDEKKARVVLVQSDGLRPSIPLQACPGAAGSGRAHSVWAL